MLPSLNRQLCRLPRLVVPSQHRLLSVALEETKGVHPEDVLVLGKTFEQHLKEFPASNAYLKRSDYVELYKNWVPRDSDILTGGHVKTGTTWLAYAILRLVENRDVEMVRETFTYGLTAGPSILDENGEPGVFAYGFSMAGAQHTPSHIKRRVVKVHVPWGLTNQKAKKYVFIVRDGRDQLVSLYLFEQTLLTREAHMEYTEDFDDFFESWINARTTWGDWFSMTHDYLEVNNTDPRFLLVVYEDFVNDIPGTLRKIANHCEIDLTDQEIEEHTEKVSFKTMEKNKTKFDYRELGIYREEGQSLLRKGTPGDYKMHLSDEQNERFLAKRREWFGDDHPWVGRE